MQSVVRLLAGWAWCLSSTGPKIRRAHQTVAQDEPAQIKREAAMHLHWYGAYGWHAVSTWWCSRKKIAMY
jgi:predicted dienelactone hydrolase